VKNQLRLWATYLPTVKPFYAVKCNPETQLMSWLAHGGTGFDCASAREVNMVKSLSYKRGAETPEIRFANPCKKEDDILFSSINNINTTVVDSHEEIDKLAYGGWTGSSYIRIRVDDEGSLMPFSAKFGASLEDVKYLATYARIKKQAISGVSFHVGSGCQDSKQYMKAIDYVSDEVFRILRRYKHKPTTIDMARNFVVNYDGENISVSKK
jgi:ornithine decarboxylase